MAKDKSRYPHHRQSLSGTGSWHSDEFIFGMTRGACAPVQRDSGRGGRESVEAGSTFEETYPSYPFSELVRLSVGLGNWLARLKQHSSKASRALPEDHTPALGTFVRPASSSQRWR